MKHVILSPNCEIYLAGCQDVIPTIKFDAVITDPPYGINVFNDKNGVKGTVNSVATANRKAILGDDKPFDPSFLLKLQGSNKQPASGKPMYERPVAIFGANHFCNYIPPYEGSWLTWDKSCGQGAAASFVDAEYIWTNRTVKRCIFRHFWMGFTRAGQDNSERSRRQHPSQKPVELMAWLLDQCRVGLGKTVLDPFMGSGSTGVACLQTGRKFIGIELDEEYFEIALNRLQAQINAINYDMIASLNEHENTE